MGYIGSSRPGIATVYGPISRKTNTRKKEKERRKKGWMNRGGKERKEKERKRVDRQTKREKKKGVFPFSLRVAF